MLFLGAAMMIEVMAGKSAAMHGLVHDATPFRFSEEDTAIDYFGKMLEVGEQFTHIKFWMYQEHTHYVLCIHIFRKFVYKLDRSHELIIFT